MIAKLSIWFLVVMGGCYAYTFTNTSGRQFDGEVLSVFEDKVTVRREADGLQFTVKQSVFCEADQEYFRSYHRPDGSYRLREGESIRALSRQLRIDLSWERGELPHYELQRAVKASGPWQALLNPTPDFALYSDFNGEPGQQFYYRVRNV